MRTAETILTVIRERGSKGLPLERLYRLLFNRDLFLRAYARLYPNDGALTRGSTPETVDAMSLRKIDRLIDDLRHERHRWTPVRRTYIPKKNGRRRPLGIPSWRDKLLQEVIRSILDAYFEPQFCASSHGFRPDRGCHTALQYIQTWRGARWFIEGDIASYFDTINHDKLIEILGEQIHDGRFLRLIRELLEAGYLEDWKFHKTISGTPQGGVISPLLANLYLHRFDQWVETVLIPEHTRGKTRKKNPAYQRIQRQLNKMRRQGVSNGAKALILQRRTLPATDTFDEGFRRLRYVRYADDFLLGFAGPKAEAEAIKRQLAEWLGDNLKLDLSAEKTLITHASTEKARFLGYDIDVAFANDKLDRRKRRTVTGGIGLRVPAAVVEAKCRRYYRKGRVMHRPDLLLESDYTIIATYQQEYRGIVQYYLPAHNVGWFNRLHWVMRWSLLKTLAAKYKSSTAKMLKRFRAVTTDTRTGRAVPCLEVRVERPDKRPLIARFGGISLARQPYAVISDQPKVGWSGRNELIQKLLADECQLCGSHDDVEVHHIRKLADLNRPGRRAKPRWVQVMAARRRKTLVVCRSCHEAIHAGRPTRERPSE